MAYAGQQNGSSEQAAAADRAALCTASGIIDIGAILSSWSVEAEDVPLQPASELPARLNKKITNIARRSMSNLSNLIVNDALILT